MRGLQVFFACACGALFLAASPVQAVTLTYPSDGQVVTLDSTANFTFRWTLAPGETNAVVTEGEQPTALNSSFCPNSNSFMDPNATACRMFSQDAGTHYASISAQTGDDGSSTPVSAPISFVVPVVVGWGCRDERCDTAGGYRNRPVVGPPFSGAGGTVWDNVPDSTATVRLVVRRGRRVVKRLQETLDSATSDGGLFYFNLMFFHIRGIRAHTHLQGTVTVKLAGKTLSRNVKIPAP